MAPHHNGLQKKSARALRRGFFFFRMGFIKVLEYSVPANPLTSMASLTS